jgi:SAM-dependent methyltransferase
MFERLSGALTDLGYLTMALWPRLLGPYRRWARRRYAQLAPGYSSWSERAPDYLAALLTTLPHLPPSPRLIVEIGAGTGAATAVLARAFPEAQLVAVDASPAMLAALCPPSARIHGVTADAVALPLSAGIADVIIAHNAPFHIAEMRRVVKPDGVVAVILSSAGRIPIFIRKLITRRLTTSVWRAVEEYRDGEGVGLLFRRTAAARAAAR